MFKKIALVILSFIICGFVIYEKDKFWNKPVVSEYNLEFDKEYTVKKITVIDGNSYAVLTDCLYYFKLNVHAVETANKDVAELFQKADKLGVIAKRSEKHIGGNIYVEFIVYHGADKFKLSSWLKEKGLVYVN